MYRPKGQLFTKLYKILSFVQSKVAHKKESFAFGIFWDSQGGGLRPPCGASGPTDVFKHLEVQPSIAFIVELKLASFQGNTDGRHVSRALRALCETLEKGVKRAL